MKYRIIQMDRRHSYHHLYRFYLEFGTSPHVVPGLFDFNECMMWFITTYGWSAEAGQIDKIRSDHSSIVGSNWARTVLKNISRSYSDLPDYCNSHWSWSTDISSSHRIYISGEAELAFFQLANPNT